MSIDDMDREITGRMDTCVARIKVLTEVDRAFDHPDTNTELGKKAQETLEANGEFARVCLEELYYNVRYSLIGEADSARAAFSDQSLQGGETSRFLFAAYHGGFSNEIDHLLPETGRVADLLAEWEHKAGGVYAEGFMMWLSEHAYGDMGESDNDHEALVGEMSKDPTRHWKAQWVMGETLNAYFAGVRRLIDLARGRNLL